MSGYGVLESETTSTSARKWVTVKRFVRKQILLILTILGVFLGIGFGVLANHYSPNQVAVTLIYYPGEIFLRMLQMLILPLIVASLVSGVASLDARASGKLGRRAVVYYMATTFSAVVLGIVLVVTIRPGSTGSDGCNNDHDAGEVVEDVSTMDTFLDLIRNMFPDNLVRSCFQQVHSKHDLLIRNCTNFTADSNTTTGNASALCPQTRHPAVAAGTLMVPPPLVHGDGMNILGLIVFSIALGIVLSGMGEQGKPLVAVFDALNEATMRLVGIVMWYSPVGIMFLIMGKIASQEDIAELIGKLGLYCATVLVGLTIHSLLILPLIAFLFLRKNPYLMIGSVSQALATAFGTSSSSATLPITIRCLEDNLKIDKRVTRFVLPIGATINMDGTALYEAVAALFIAQYTCTPLNFGHIVAVSITATAASIGAAGIPNAGLFTMVIVLSAVGLPPDMASLVFAVDWLLDRFRTMVNVLGDSYGAAIVAHLSRHDLTKTAPIPSSSTLEGQTAATTTTFSTSSETTSSSADKTTTEVTEGDALLPHQ